MLAGALGERRPDQAIYEENWHHTYAVFGWTNTILGVGDLEPRARVSGLGLVVRVRVRARTENRAGQGPLVACPRPGAGLPEQDCGL